MDSVAASLALARLAERGLVSRSTTTTAAAPCWNYRPAANAPRHNSRHWSLQMERKLLADLSREEKHMLDTLLDKLSERLQKL